MNEHPLLTVLNSSPINRQAGIVASQRGCAEGESDLSREEIKTIMTRLERKQRLLKVVLRVRNHCQHKNLIARYKMGLKSNYRPKRIIEEYLRVGQSLQILGQRLAQFKRNEGREARKLLGAIENKWRAEHPGCIWDGRQLVAPNGAVFSRVAASMEASQC